VSITHTPRFSRKSRHVPRLAQQKSQRLLALSMAAAAVPLAVATSSGAATNTYNGVSGNWNDASKWTLGHVPMSFEDVVLGNGSSGSFGNVTVTVNTNTATINSLNIEGTNGGTVTLSQAANTLTFFGPGEVVGVNNGGRGALVLSGGTHTLIASGPTIVFGLNAGAIGSGTLSGTATLSASGEIIGNSGTGSFNQTGGTNETSLTLGNNAGSSGSYSLSGGTLNGANEFVGYDGTATFTQTGGSHSAAFMSVALDSGSVGTYTMSGGTLNVSGVIVVGSGPNASGTFTQFGGTLTNTDQYVGNSGSGTFTQAGGSAQINGNLVLGNSSTGKGTATVSAGTFTVAGSAFVGSNGIGVLSLGGTTHSVGATGSNGLFIGFNAGSTGTVAQSAGNTTISGTEYVGYGGSGTLNLTGGKHSNTESGFAVAMPIGVQPGSTGNVTLSGNAGLFVNNDELVGQGGTGTFTQSGGTNSAFRIDIGDPGPGTYSLSAGTLTLSAVLAVGNSGQGTLTQSGGGITVPQFDMALNGGTGTYNLQGGTLTVFTEMTVGSNGGVSTVNHSGGTNNISGTSGTLVVGGFSNGANAYNLSGSGNVTVGGSSYLGAGGRGTFNQTGGSATVAASEYVGFRNLSFTNSLFLGNGTLLVSGGTHSVTGSGSNGLFIGAYPGATAGVTVSGTGVLSVTNEEDVGYNGNGTFTQTGGSNSAFKVILAANSGSSVGTYTMSGGTLNVGLREYAGYAGTGTFNQSGGVNTVGENLYLAVQAGSTGFFNLSGGGVLNVAGSAYVGYGSTGTFTQSGGVNAVTGTVFIPGNPGPWTGTYNLQGGTLSPGAILLQAGGTFNQTGGTLSPTTFTQSGGTVLGTLQNQGTYIYNSGTFPGRLVNQGTVVINGDPTFGNGVDNRGTFGLPTGRTATVNGPGLDNSGQFTLSGGVLTGSGPLANNGQFSGFGTIAGTGGFVNNAIFTSGSGNVVLSNTGPNLNAASMALSAGWQLQLTGSGLTNAGTIDLNSSLVAGPAVLNNSSSGVVRGPGAITAPLLNGGSLLAPSGTLNLIRPLTNAGTIQINSGASITGGAVNNAGSIQGAGTVANALSNTGTIEPVGGTLTIGSAMPSNAGLLTASTGNKLLMVAGLASNAGVISLAEGTFDNGPHPLANTGQISGFGTFRSSALANAPGGKLVLTGGISTVNGDVNNAAGGSVQVLYDPAVFTGNVVNNGTFKITGTKVTFAGTFTNGGTYFSDPADNLFGDLAVGSGGALVGGAGDRFFLSGELLNASGLAATWNTRDAELHFSGSPSHTLTTPGVDHGATFSGYDANFAWGVVEVAAGESLTVADANAAPGAALYVRDLLLDGRLAQLPLLSTASADVTIYYDATSPANVYLDGRTYTLAGGGSLVAVPEPSPAAVLFSTAPLALLARRRKRLRRPSPRL